MKTDIDRCRNTVWIFLALFVMVGTITLAGGGTGEAVRKTLMVTPDTLRHGELWRVGSYPFLVGRPIDLLFKCLIFLYIGLPLERMWGTRRFLNLLAVSTFGGGIMAALLGQHLEGGWAVGMTLMLIHGFIFAESRILLFFVIPMRVRTLSIILTAAFLVSCITKGLLGLALFAGLFCGVLYYMFVTQSVPWVRRARRKATRAVAHPGETTREAVIGRLMDRAREIMQTHDAGQTLSEQDRALLDELLKQSDPGKDICLQYSFSPDNGFCPPCKEFGRCLKRYLETDDDAEATAG